MILKIIINIKTRCERTYPYILLILFYITLFLLYFLFGTTNGILLWYSVYVSNICDKSIIYKLLLLAIWK